MRMAEGREYTALEMEEEGELDNFQLKLQKRHLELHNFQCELKKRQLELKNLQVVQTQRPEPVGINSQGVYSPPTLPTKLKPTRNYIDQDELNQLVQRLQTIKLGPATLQRFIHVDGCTCQGQSQQQGQIFFFPSPRSSPAPALASRSFAVLTGVKGIGKLKVIKQLLSTHPRTFSKVVQIDAKNPMASLKMCANNSQLDPDNETVGDNQSECNKIGILYSKIAKQFQQGERILFLFVNATSLEQIKNYLPENFCQINIICHVIVTSQSRNWEKEENLRFYRHSGFDFQEIPLFQGLSLKKTQEFCSQISLDLGLVMKLNQFILESIYKLTGGLQQLTSFISVEQSSGSHSENKFPQFHEFQLYPLPVELLILKYFRLPSQHSALADFSQRPKAILWGNADGDETDYDKKYENALVLFQIMCALDPQNLKLKVIVYFYCELSPDNPNCPRCHGYIDQVSPYKANCPRCHDYIDQVSPYKANCPCCHGYIDQVSPYKANCPRCHGYIDRVSPEKPNCPRCHGYIDHLSPYNAKRRLPSVYVDHLTPGNAKRRLPENYTDQLFQILEVSALIKVKRAEDGKVDAIHIAPCLRKRMNSEDTAVKRKLKNLLLRMTSFDPLKFHLIWPYILSFNEIHNIRHGYYDQFLIEFIQNLLEPYNGWPTLKKALKEKVKQGLGEKYPQAFQDLPTLRKRDFVLPVLFFLLFLADVGTDLYNAAIIFMAGYTSFFGLALFLVIFPFCLLCKIHQIDRAKYNEEMNQSHGMSRWDYLKTFTGTGHSYFSQLWYIWKFWWVTDKLDGLLLSGRLCTMRANAEHQGIYEPFLESFPQLLLQFSLYLLSYTQEYSELSNVMQESLIPFELSLVVSLFVFGIALTKMESVYFGWEIKLYGIKLLGYRSIHLLINVAHATTLVFCTGIVSVIFPPFIFVISLVSCLTASAWILSNTTFVEEEGAGNLKSGEKSKMQKWATFFASFHPGFVEKVEGETMKLDWTLKQEFLTRRPCHDLLLLHRAPRNSDIIYLFVFLSSVLISAFTAIYWTFNKYQEAPMTTVMDETWPISVIQKYSFYFILWLPILFMWEMLRQLLNHVYLKYSKVSPLPKKDILKDLNGNIRYPVYTFRWLPRRLYYQMRQIGPGVFGQTLEQVTQAAKEFYDKKVPTKLKTLIVFLYRLICNIFYLLFLPARLLWSPFERMLSNFVQPF